MKYYLHILYVLILIYSNNFVYCQCNLLTVDAGTNISICDGQSVQIGGNPTADNGLLGSLSYSWSPNLSITDPSIANPIVNPSSTTTYTVTVTRTIGPQSCSESSSIIVTVNPLPNVTFSSLNDVCLNKKLTNIIYDVFFKNIDYCKNTHL